MSLVQRLRDQQRQATPSFQTADTHSPKAEPKLVDINQIAQLTRDVCGVFVAEGIPSHHRRRERLTQWPVSRLITHTTASAQRFRVEQVIQSELDMAKLQQPNGTWVLVGADVAIGTKDHQHHIYLRTEQRSADNGAPSWAPQIATYGEEISYLFLALEIADQKNAPEMIWEGNKPRVKGSDPAEMLQALAAKGMLQTSGADPAEVAALQQQNEILAAALDEQTAKTESLEAKLNRLLDMQIAMTKAQLDAGLAKDTRAPTMNEAPAPESRTSPAAPADIDDLNSYQRKALAALADVGMDDPVALAADAAGVRTDTIDRWRKDSPAFNAAWNEATSKPSGARAALAAAGDEVDPDLDGE